MTTRPGKKAEAAAPAAPVYSPHSAHVWPERVFNDTRLEKLTRAGIATYTLAHLLAADDLMDGEHRDEPDNPPPFSPFTQSGLFQALLVCVGEVQSHIEALQSRSHGGGE